MIISRDSLVRSVVELTKDTTIIDKNGKFIPSLITGTALLVAKGNDLYIVTAAHVARSDDFSAKVILRGKNDRPQTIMLMDLISNPTPHWIFHARADLAVLHLSPKRRVWMSGVLNQKFIPISMISSDSTNAVSRDLQLTVIGFPFSLGVQGRFSPLTYRTFASSGFITMPRADTHTLSEFILLENPSVGGYSGGPVFDVSMTVINSMTSTGSGTTCYGFMHGTLSDETGGKLAAVTPSYFLFDLIK